MDKSKIENAWIIDPSMVGKKVAVSIEITPDGSIYNEQCQGDKFVCSSALRAVNSIGKLPSPPKGCKDCQKIKITMTPHL